MRQYTAWVLADAHDQQRLLCLTDSGDEYWDRDLRRAVQFGRRVDAKRVARWSDTDARPVEKQFG